MLLCEAKHYYKVIFALIPTVYFYARGAHKHWEIQRFFLLIVSKCTVNFLCFSSFRYAFSSFTFFHSLNFDFISNFFIHFFAHFPFNFYIYYRLKQDHFTFLTIKSFLLRQVFFSLPIQHVRFIKISFFLSKN